MQSLERSLSFKDAIYIGLAAMLGAGIFAAIGPAYQAAGNYLVISLLIAGFIAYCNAVSSAQLAACHPEAGGTYLYARERLNPLAGFIAGACFLTGKTASGAAMALTFAHYALPDYEKPAALVALALLTGLNLWGIQKTARISRAIVVLIIASLLLLAFFCLISPTTNNEQLFSAQGFSVYGIVQGAAIWFFAFAGYARLATLAEEVKNPARVLTRAIPVALFIVLGLYLLVAISVVWVTPGTVLGQTSAPLAAALQSAGLSAWEPALRSVAAVACLGVLIALIAGISRTLMAMSRNADMPTFFAKVSEKRRVPARAEVIVAIAIGLVIIFLNVSEAIGFSAFCVLLYYALANFSALKLTTQERHWPIHYSYTGLACCVFLAFSVPLKSLVIGALSVAALTAYYCLQRRHQRQ